MLSSVPAASQGDYAAPKETNVVRKILDSPTPERDAQ
jgi:hypothetical protein